MKHRLLELRKRTQRLFLIILISVTAIGLNISRGYAGSSSSLKQNQMTYLPLVLRGQGLALPPADEASSRLNLPDGFVIRIYASTTGNPRLMAIGPDGFLYRKLR